MESELTYRVLHAGCGREPLPAWIPATEEVRLDINPAVQPHIVAPLTDMGEIGPFDAAYSSHCLEHLPPDDARVALAEFRRVLKPGAPLIIIVPNIEGVPCDDTVIYVCDAGPITGKDMHLGHQGLVRENPYMAHWQQFVPDTLSAMMAESGFDVRYCIADGYHNIMAVGVA